MTETVVDKINFEDSGGQLIARSVVIVDKSGERREIKAKKEIVVSGGMKSMLVSKSWHTDVLGAYCSPGVLMRSGIGPKQELEKLGIKCLADSPGVGKNLLDHLVRA
jgi:choline dehydrogenase-like flavoprotein